MDVRSRLDALMGDRLRKQRLEEALADPRLSGVERATAFFAKSHTEREAARDSLADLFPNGRYEVDGSRRVFVVRWEASPGDRTPMALPARAAFAESLSHAESIRAVHARAGLNEWDPARIAFLDTETTGLAGGAGTFPFLIGVGWFESFPDRFVVEQYFAEDYGHEPLMLELLSARLASFACLGTYNGRTFDVPLLRTRYVLNRARAECLDRPNLDLLAFSRRLWRGTLPSVSLGTVEREILGITRTDDAPGSEIPEIWQHFARTGRADRVRPVLLHNAQDVASLAVLLALHVEAVRSPGPEGPLTRAGECVGLARWFAVGRDHPRAVALLHRALRLTREPDQEDAILATLATLHKRAGEWEEALSLWRELAKRPLASAIPAWTALAMHAERVAKDPAGALRLVDECLKRIELEAELRRLTGRVVPGLKPGTVEALESRRARLMTRVNRLATKKGWR